MTKKHFIELADVIRKPGMLPATIDIVVNGAMPVDADVELKAVLKRRLLDAIALDLADFCKSQNYRFDRERWLVYIAGECGPNGKKVTK